MKTTSAILIMKSKTKRIVFELVKFNIDIRNNLHLESINILKFDKYKWYTFGPFRGKKAKESKRAWKKFKKKHKL
ncbi:MAG: hypothetical protein AABY22_22955 [Nanoarchaeota archaeon]